MVTAAMLACAWIAAAFGGAGLYVAGQILPAGIAPRTLADLYLALVTACIGLDLAVLLTLRALGKA